MEPFIIYVQALVTAAGVIMGVWGFFKVIKEIKKDNDDEVKRRMRWDKAAATIEEKTEIWDKGLADIDNIRGQIVERYEERLDDQDARTQDLANMLIEILRAQDAILEALIEQGIGNGEIKKTRAALNTFITEQIGK